jgi:hypothetical protein
MGRILFGAVLVIAGIAAFIEAHTHHALKPLALPEGPGEPSHLSHTAYDLLRVGAWALVIIGGLLVVMGLIRFGGRRGSERAGLSHLGA